MIGANVTRALTAVVAILIATPGSSEIVEVKYRGAVDLKPFACADTPRSKFHPARLL
jgi:hypothetical protein